MKREEEKFIRNIKSDLNLDESIQHLFDKYSRVYYKIVNSICQDSELRLELAAECKYNIYQAAKKFKPEKKVKFSSYFGNFAKWSTFNKITESQKRNNIKNELKKNSSSDSFYESKIEMQKREDYSFIINDLKSNSDARIEKIFRLRYLVGNGNKLMPWKNVSEKLNLSIQGCINIHNAYIKKIKLKKYNK